MVDLIHANGTIIRNVPEVQAPAYRSMGFRPAGAEPVAPAAESEAAEAVEPVEAPAKPAPKRAARK